MGIVYLTSCKNTVVQVQNPQILMTLSPLKQAPYAGWDDALWLEQGPLTLVFVPQVGGRIMGVRWQQRDLYWVNPDLAGQTVAVQALATPAEAKVELGLKLWGGNKTWLAPQEGWTAGLPFLDLDSGAYQLTVDDTASQPVAVQMQSPICRETGIQITRTVIPNAEHNGWRLIHQVQNCGNRPICWAPWSNSMVRRPARVFLPKRADSDFPAGVKTFEQEGDSGAVRSQVLSHLDSVVAVDCIHPIKFKFGVDSDRGVLLAVLLSDQAPYLGLLQTFPTFPPATYGHGCSTEVFNAAAYAYLELETHGPVTELAPGDRIEFTEHHQVIELPDLPQSPEMYWSSSLPS